MTMTTFIMQDLRTRIQRGQQLPEKLTLAEIATMYGVSFTPVRRAVNGLVAEELIERLDNGRLAVNPVKLRELQQAAPSLPPEQPRNWEQVIADAVLGYSLRGDARFLREEATAKQFGIGRTVVRQVFNRLAGKGLLEHVPRCGWRVRTFSERDMLAYLEVRETLELKALELAYPRLIPADLEQMLAGNPDPSRVPSPRLDNNLHQYFIQKSGNRYIADFFQRHGHYYTTIFDRAALGVSIVAEMAHQHRQILRSLLDSHLPLALSSLAHHIQSQGPLVKTLMLKLSHSEPLLGE